MKIKRSLNGHEYVYIDGFGEDGTWIHSESCYCQHERVKIKREWNEIDMHDPSKEA